MPSRSQKRSFICSPILNSLPRWTAVKPSAYSGGKLWSMPANSCSGMLFRRGPPAAACAHPCA